jgi:hypothetical protein
MKGMSEPDLLGLSMEEMPEGSHAQTAARVGHRVVSAGMRSKVVPAPRSPLISRASTAGIASLRKIGSERTRYIMSLS